MAHLNYEKFKGIVLDTPENIFGELYVITNTINNKQYVGQVVSHRLNNTKYRPFGFVKRFADHISEAMCNTKKKQCSYLNNAIRKHGVDNFKITLIDRCKREELNEYEIKYIKEYNTLYPNGYNLTEGGKTSSILPEHRKKAMANTQKQFEQKKLERFRNVKVDVNNLEKYIKENKCHGDIYYRVKVDDIECIFVGKYMPKDALKQNAIDFLKKVADMNLEKELSQDLRGLDITT